MGSSNGRDLSALIDLRHELVGRLGAFLASCDLPGFLGRAGRIAHAAKSHT